jgi:outer membrane protein, heavy metal efflux system
VYGFVEPRTDADPPGNGDDDLGLTGGITIPIWRDGIRAGVEEATGRRLAAEQQRRAAVVDIDRELEALRGRLPEIGRQVELFEGTLRIQSEQALRSAEAAYASGGVDALALLDSERTLLDVRLAAVRSRVDLAIALGELERTIAGPLPAAPVLTSDAAAGASPPVLRVNDQPPRLETRTSEPDTRNPQPATRDSEPAARNPEPATRKGASS